MDNHHTLYVLHCLTSLAFGQSYFAFPKNVKGDAKEVVKGRAKEVYHLPTSLAISLRNLCIPLRILLRIYAK